MSNPGDGVAEKDFEVDRWPASLAVIACVALYVVLPDTLVIQPKWLVPALEIAALVPLAWHRRHSTTDPRWTRPLAIGLFALINIANIVSVVLLVRHLLKPGTIPADGRSLVYSAILIWATNVIVFSLWFWELDRGGPTKRFTSEQSWPDFQFPQMENPTLAPATWHPRYVDYLYVAFTNAAAFSPTDAMPLSRTAKILMTVESGVSMITVIVVAARAVNILH